MKKYITILLFVSMYLGLSAQLKPVAQKVQQAKSKATASKPIQQLLKTQVSGNARYMNKTDKNLENAKYFTYDKEQAKRLIQAHNEYIAIEVSGVDEESWILDLVEVSLDFYNYQVHLGSGKDYFGDMDHSVHYRGVVRGMENTSLVSISMYEGELMGIISIQGRGNYNLKKMKKGDTHMIFNDAEVKIPVEEVEPVTEPKGDLPKLPSFLKNQQIASSSNYQARKNAITSCIGVHLETEFDMYYQYGQSVDSVENYVVGLFNQVATIFENEGVYLVLDSLVIWDVLDPFVGPEFSFDGSEYIYDGANHRWNFDHFYQFTDTTKAPDNRIHQLISTERRAGSNFVWPTFLFSEDYYLSSMLALKSDNVFSYSAHEMARMFGYSLGSPYTNDCFWNGNNTQIDGCVGNTLWIDWGSNLPNCSTLPDAPNGGTIMSHCRVDSFDAYLGLTVVIAGANFANGFGPQPGAIIRNTATSGRFTTTCNLITIGCEDNISVTQNVAAMDSLVEKAKVEITASNTIANQGVAIYVAEQRVKLIPGFNAAGGSSFRASNSAVTCDTTLPSGSQLNYDKVFQEDFNIAAHSLTSDQEEVLEALVGLQVYPNPAQSNVNIAWAEASEIAVLELTDMSGKIISRQSVEGLTRQQLDLTFLDQGIYLINAKGKNGQNYTQKISVIK